MTVNNDDETEDEEDVRIILVDVTATAAIPPELHSHTGAISAGELWTWTTRERQPGSVGQVSGASRT